MIQSTFDETSEDYKAFVEKFKPKKTTDDCYTPANIYDAVLEWAAKKYGFDKSAAVRPFWPGADFERHDYPTGCVVVDNPPFSIISKITRHYNSRGIRYFLFGPALTIFSNRGESNYVIAGASVTYANGAVVNTSFITNLGEYLIEAAPDLRDIIRALDDENRRATTKELPKYNYPPAIVTAAGINYLAVHHTPFKVRRDEAVFIRKMDEQSGSDKAIFGGGFLLTEEAARRRAAAERAAAERAAAERAAAERAAAERAAAKVWKLSPREIEIQKILERRAAK